VLSRLLLLVLLGGVLAAAPTIPAVNEPIPEQ
jgi:hypothetical protein